MRIRVYDRIPPLPWEPGYWAPGRLRVGLEAALRADPGPIEFLRSIWPERYVVWNGDHQLWEVRQQNPVTGRDERVELLYRKAASPEGFLVPAYIPFNYEYLLTRARQRWQFLELGPARYEDMVNDKNRAVSRSVVRGIASEMAAGLGELRRYFPVLAGDGEKIPLVAVATDLTPKGRICRS